MEKQLRYLNSWKGQVLKAIIVDGIVTWRGIQRVTKLDEKPLNIALSELFNLNLIGKEGHYYFILDEQLISEYLNYYKSTRPRKKLVKDQYHAELVEYVVKKPLFSGPAHQRFIEYQLDDQSTYRYIDVVKHHFRGDIPQIAIFEVKPKIDDFGATIRQIKYYKSLINNPSEPNFGAYSEKDIFTYLVILAIKENLSTFEKFKNSIIASDLDYIMFANPKKHEDRTYNLRGFTQEQYNALNKWINEPEDNISSQESKIDRIYCTKCGQLIIGRYNFCTNCGAKLRYP